MQNVKSFMMLLAFQMVANLASAQTADVSINADIRLTWLQEAHSTNVRLFDPMGRYSTLNLNFNLESTYRARIVQRFVRIPGDDTLDLLEQAYLEAPGLWRFGKIDLPFGQKSLIRDFGLGAELNTFLVFDNMPIKVATVDNGLGKVRGFAARLGSKVGVSIAQGNHFGASGTSLNALRRPEDAPGVGAGYKLIYGADTSATVGNTILTAEFVFLRQGETATDEPAAIYDLTSTWGRPAHGQFQLGLAHNLTSGLIALRAEVTVPIQKNVSLVGFGRFVRGANVVSLGMRVRF